MQTKTDNGIFAFNSREFLSPFDTQNIEQQLIAFKSIAKERRRETILSDTEIIAMWLKATTKKPSTKRVKRKEGERLTFFGKFVLGKRLSEMNSGDISQYVEFLSDPQPSDSWVSDTKWRRSDLRWRPFSGGLCPSSIRHALVLIGNLFRWMVDLGLTDNNPTLSVGKPGRPSQFPLDRLLPDEGIKFALQAINFQRSSKIRARNRFMFRLFHLTGISTLEAINANISSINEELRFIEIQSTEKRSRRIPIPDTLLADLYAYRSVFGLNEVVPDNEDQALLLSSGRNHNRLSASSVYFWITHTMKNAAKLARSEGADALAEQLTKASTHWLRHTRLRNWAEEGVDFLSVNHTAGHSSLGTTKKYFDNL
ncbi:tyrosine-type recombinase/integrase [Pseudomonas chlororaphis]|uniref:tyrosine-type recombinase/integrase n=1 Tax=Pseudomonas chlororaphis TaxID=587753 RepID=UPI0023658AD7|nr:site-specific integrase [Pseudomonas chlororaphis]WDH19925.1 site-specific integrase [Pseudomonas chlororaphis]